MSNERQRKSRNPGNRFLPLLKLAWFASLLSTLVFAFVCRSIPIALIFLATTGMLSLLISYESRK